MKVDGKSKNLKRKPICLKNNLLNAFLVRIFQDCRFDGVQDEEVPEYREEDVQHLDIRSVSHQIEEFSAELEQADVNLTSVFQYREKKQELDEKKAQWNHLDEQRRRV